MNEQNYIDIITNQDYPDSFRLYFIELYKLSNNVNSKEYNEALTSIVENTSENLLVRLESTLSIDSREDVVSFLSVLYEEADEHSKSIILKNLSLLQPKLANEFAKDILNDYRSYGLDLKIYQ